MDEKITLKEYADRKGVTLTTVYRWIKSGKVRSERQGGALYLLVESEEWRGLRPSDSETIQELRRENDWLRGKVDELTRQLGEAELRHYEVVKGLIERLEEHLRALTNFQQKGKRWWQRKD